MIKDKLKRLNKWIKFEDTQPKEGMYLCFLSNGLHTQLYYDGKKWIKPWGSLTYDNVKYWKYLENPMEEEI